MEKIKVVHWKNVLGSDIDAFRLVLQHNQAMKKYGKTSVKLPDGASEMFERKIWQLHHEGWYNPRIDYDGDIVFMHLIPSENSDLRQQSISIIDTSGKRREYIEKRDFVHNEYQDSLEREYYDPDFPSEVDEAIEKLTKEVSV